jgi:hypothetical protein
MFFSGRVNMMFVKKIQLVTAIILVFVIVLVLTSCKKERLNPETYKARERLISIGHDFTEEGFLKAIDSKDANLVKLYLESGMSVDQPININKLKVPVIFYALEKGNDLIAQLFIDRGADLNASVKGMTVLMKAVEKANVDTLSMMIKKKADINKAGGDGVTPIMLAVERNNHGAIWLLMNSGADINKADVHGITPLMRAVRVGETDIVKELLKKGANAKAVTKNGLKTTKMIGEKNKEALTILLKDAGAEF